MVASRTLIALVSNGDAARKAIDAVKADRVVLVTTPEAREEAVVAIAVLGLPGDPLVYDLDPIDPVAWHEALRALIAAEKAAGCDVTVDITGGKKPMGFGAYAAAEEARVPTIYVDTPRGDIRTSDSMLVEIPSVREVLGLDWLRAGDEAYRLAHYDGAAELYRRAAGLGGPRTAGADRCARAARARSAWLAGHFGVARRLWPPDAVPVPQPWKLLAGRLKGASAREEGLSDDAFAAWLADRALALELRRHGKHALEAVAGAALAAAEIAARFCLRRWALRGATVRWGDTTLAPDDLTTAAPDPLTFGPVLGLVCDGFATRRKERLELHDAPEPEIVPARKLFKALRGKPMRGGKFEGVEIRNGLAHGYVELEDVERWNEEALPQLAKLTNLLLSWLGGHPAPAPSEDPADLRRGQ